MICLCTVKLKGLHSDVSSISSVIFVTDFNKWLPTILVVISSCVCFYQIVVSTVLLEDLLGPVDLGAIPD